MKKFLAVILSVSAGVLYSQVPASTVSQASKRVRLVTTCNTVLDGQILCVNSFDVIAYTNYHSRITTILSPFLILNEPIPHNLLMQAHVHFVSARDDKLDAFAHPERHAADFDPLNESDKASVYQRFAVFNVPGPPVPEKQPKMGRGPGVLLIVGYEIVKAVVKGLH